MYYSPTVGMVHIVSPFFNLKSMVVFPAPFSPVVKLYSVSTIRTGNPTELALHQLGTPKEGCYIVADRMAGRRSCKLSCVGYHGLCI